MPDTRRKRGSRSRARRRLAVVGIGAFVLVDLGLVAFALTREPSGLAADAEPGPTSSTAAVGAQPSASPSATQSVATEAVPPTRLLSAVDGDTAWRAEAGTCSPGAQATAPSLESTTTAGETWAPSAVSTAIAPSGVDRLEATDETTAFVVGPAGSTCAPAFSQTFSGGAAYADYPDRLTGSWYVARTDRGTVHSPAGGRAAPCPVVVDLAVVSDAEGGVLCSDRTFFRTLDGGDTWDAGTVVDGAVSVTADVGTYLVASVGAADCAGTAVSVPSSTPGSAATRVGCAPATSETPGAIALSAGTDALWLWADDAVLVSTDGGVTW
ncbi:hypothetical protein ITJ55_03650 [Frigoribacterium sp. VKM Ac-1396]|uniref:hypothetical protein n=1 Tax=Frigoribacterium sp. VKM Ac-1396 TaxID=2783821 RepID=UPI00188CAA40|nr:hypothetical protein [Frigoribacterium sp. VKM Ac-1396]MBF4599898.1 hypothetical protein [Frigoribacterium sp. VKM Ac-1396]